MFNTNLILMVDSYKASHWLQYKPNTDYVYSYIESRGGKWDSTLVFGLQAFLKEYLSKPISQADIEEAAEFFTAHGEPFNREGWEYIVNKHNGFLPLSIKAVDEGSLIPTHNIIASIVNTDPKCFWLTSYMETAILRAIWYPSTVATNSLECKVAILKALEKSSDDPAGQIMFKLHDFGGRGVSSAESAALGGMAHLVNFMGSDTVEGVLAARRYYNEPMAGFSIPAAEHSTITCWGKPHEVDAYRNMITQFANPGSMVAVVSDSYDLMHACRHIWGEQLKQEVIDSGATVVVRPDCYDPETEVLTENGWVKFPDLQPGVRIMQMHDDWTTEPVLPSRIVAQQYDGDMVQFSDEKGRLDLLVTPNHRMILSDKNGRLHVQEAHEAKFWDKRNIPRVALAEDNGNLLTAFERFLIAFQADGSYPSSHERTENPGIIAGHISTRFQFQKRRKIERLQKICEDAGLVCDVHQEKERWVNLDQYTIYVRVPVNMPLSKTFDWVNPMSRDYNWCDEFIREIAHWDATIRENSPPRVKYDSTILSNVDVVQLVAIRGGWGATYSCYEDNRDEKFSNVHSLSLTNKVMIGGQSVQKNIVPYKGKVFCVTVPTGRIIVRRNRKIVVCGNSGDPEVIPVECIRILSEKFGFSINTKGYKVLPSCVRVIQGDGITAVTLVKILDNLLAAGFSADNIAFGMGGGLLQMVNRDDGKWAMKCSAMSINGVWVDVYKEPKTDPGKRSKRGRLALVSNDFGDINTIKVDQDVTEGERCQHLRIDLLHEVFRDGRVLVNSKFSDIREKANIAAFALAGVKRN